MKTASPPPSAPAASSASFLENLRQDVTTQFSSLETKPAAPVNIEAKVRELQQKLDQTVEIKDETKRNDAQRILEADLANIRETEKKDQDEFAMLVLGLDVLMKEVGNGLQDLLKLSPDEEALIAGAKKRIADAEAALAEANKKTTLFGVRTRAVQAATAELKTAQTALPEVEAQVARMTRLRLQNADIEGSMQTYMAMVERTTQIMTERNKKTGEQLGIVRSRLTAAQAIKKQAAQALEALDRELSETEETLRKEEDLLVELTNGSSEYTTQETKISDLRQQVEEIRGKRNTALIVYQSKEKFVGILETHAIGTRRIFDDQKIWLAKRASDAEERQVTWMNRLETMKAISDLEVAGAQDKVGAAVDLADAAYMAEASSAADKQRQEMFEDQPNQIRQLAEIQKAQAVNISKIREREGNVFEQFKNRYGVDVLDSSYLGIEREAAKEAADAPA